MAARVIAIQTDEASRGGTRWHILIEVNRGLDERVSLNRMTILWNMEIPICNAHDSIFRCFSASSREKKAAILSLIQQSLMTKQPCSYSNSERKQPVSTGATLRELGADKGLLLLLHLLQRTS